MIIIVIIKLVVFLPSKFGYMYLPVPNLPRIRHRQNFAFKYLYE